MTGPDITLAAPTKEGYVFDSRTPSNTIPTGSTGDKTFTAVRNDRTEEYTITYVDTVGGTVVNGQTNAVTYNASSIVTLYDLEKSGYTFNEWYDNDQFTGSTVTTFGPGETGDKTFYAEWNKTAEAAGQRYRKRNWC